MPHYPVYIKCAQHENYHLVMVTLLIYSFVSFLLCITRPLQLRNGSCLCHYTSSIRTARAFRVMKCVVAWLVNRSVQWSHEQRGHFCYGHWWVLVSRLKPLLNGFIRFFHRQHWQSNNLSRFLGYFRSVFEFNSNCFVSIEEFFEINTNFRKSRHFSIWRI